MKEESDSKFVTRSWNIVSYESNSIYSVRNEIIKVWKSNLYYYKDAYILVKGNVTITGNIADQVINCKTKLGLKWTKHCVIPTDDNDNDDSNSDNIIILLMTQNYVSL